MTVHKSSVPSDDIAIVGGVVILATILIVLVLGAAVLVGC